MNYESEFKEPIRTNSSSFLVNGDPYRLAGNHTWNTVQSMSRTATPNYASLNDIVGNFTRLWILEPGKVDTTNSNPEWRIGDGDVFNITPTLYRKKDGLYDLERPRGAFLDRLETVVRRLDRRDIVTGVMLSDGAWNRTGALGWETHPLNPKNNIQGVGPTEVNGVHTSGSWNQYQRKLYRAIVERLKPYNNVIYEIGNELASNSIGWKTNMVDFIKKITPKAVGVSHIVTRSISNEWMTQTDADFYVPNLSNGTPSLVRKPSILDTDHTWPLRSNVPGLSTYWNQGRDLWLMDGLNEGILRNITNLQPDRDFITGLPLG